MNDKIKLLDLKSEWVTQTFNNMSLDQKIGQLLLPFLRTYEGLDTCMESIKDIELGGAFFFPENKENLQAIKVALDKKIKIPPIIASDLENGAGRMVNDAVIFPDLMAVGATNNNEYAYNVGKAAAMEGRECGIHWSFGPVVDINVNKDNPITNTRSFGDDPEMISRLGQKLMNGMQDHGLVACAKHFPGDGFDDRDQHLCTTINPLSFEDWKKTSGKMFQDMIDNGVLTIMTGHIALPCYDPGNGETLLDAPPAVLSKKLVTDLLRNEMGFEGVIITDAVGMGGSVTRYSIEETVIRSLEAGNDMVLFCEPESSFKAIKEALESKRLNIKEIEMSVKRILALKEKLGIHQDKEFKICPEDDKKKFQNISNKIGRDALTIVQDKTSKSKLPLKKGMKVLTYHIRADEKYNVDGIDQKLRDRGLEIVSINEKEDFPNHGDLDQYDAILILSVFGPNWGTNRIRMNGSYCRPLWYMFKNNKSPLMFSFGSPYIIYDWPQVSLYGNVYSPDESSQNAVISYLFGELKAIGKSPVDLEKLFKSN